MCRAHSPAGVLGWKVNNAALHTHVRASSAPSSNDDLQSSKSVVSVRDAVLAERW
jgi:hypothetical protein